MTFRGDIDEIELILKINENALKSVYTILERMRLNEEARQRDK